MLTWVFGIPSGAGAETDLRKMTLWALQWGPFSGIKFPFWYTQNKFQLFQIVKSKRKKKFSAMLLCHWGPSTYLLAQLLLYWWGPWCIWWEPCKRRGSCQQLLTLLTLKSATGRWLNCLCFIFTVHLCCHQTKSLHTSSICSLEYGTLRGKDPLDQKHVFVLSQNLYQYKFLKNNVSYLKK